jgi:endonuclease I
MEIKTKPTKGKTSKVITPKYKKIIKEWNEATPYEVWEGFRDNFVFAFILLFFYG